MNFINIYLHAPDPLKVKGRIIAVPVDHDNVCNDLHNITRYDVQNNVYILTSVSSNSKLHVSGQILDNILLKLQYEFKIEYENH